MSINIIFEKENIIFKFLLPDVKDRLNYYAYEHGVEKANNLIDILKSSSDSQTVTCPHFLYHF